MKSALRGAFLLPAAQLFEFSMTHLFTYGTLCVPEVMRAVIGYDLSGEPATLPDFRRRLITDCVFPGITSDAEATVIGTLFRNLDEAAMRRLDAYEAAFYQRRSVVVTAGQQRISAEVYLLPASEAWRLSETPWDEAVFVRDHLSSYLNG